MPVGITGSFNAVDVRDLAEGVIACAHKGRKGEGYILSNCFLSIQDLELVSRYTGIPEVKLFLPVWSAKVIAFFSEIQAKMTKKPARFTAFSIYNLARNNNFSCDKAKRELGYSTRTNDQTIADTVKWLQQEGKIGSTASCIETA